MSKTILFKNIFYQKFKTITITKNKKNVFYT